MRSMVPHLLASDPQSGKLFQLLACAVNTPTATIRRHFQGVVSLLSRVMSDIICWPVRAIQQNSFATGKERALVMSALGRQMKHASECNHLLAILEERYVS